MIKYLLKLPSTGRWCGLVVKELVGQPGPPVIRFPIILIILICHLAFESESFNCQGFLLIGEPVIR